MDPVTLAVLGAGIILSSGCRGKTEERKAPSNDDNRKITANGIYNGVLIQDPGDLKRTDYEKATKEKLGISLFFQAFSSGLDFPTERCDALNKENITAFIKLEPWSAEGKTDTSFNLDKIISGKFDRQIDQFAGQCAKWGKPVFISFGHEMNGNWYPWSGDPEK